MVMFCKEIGLFAWNLAVGAILGGCLLYGGFFYYGTDSVFPSASRCSESFGDGYVSAGKKAESGKVQGSVECLDDYVRRCSLLNGKQIHEEISRYKCKLQDPPYFCDKLSLNDEFFLHYLAYRLGMFVSREEWNSFDDFDDLRTPIREGMVESWAIERPEEIVSFFRNRSEDLAGARHLCKKISFQLAKNSPDLVKDWEMLLPEAPKRACWRISFAQRVKKYPQNMLNLATESIGNGADKESHTEEIAEAWAMIDEKTVGSWIETMPDKWRYFLQMKALGGAMKKDPEKAIGLYRSFDESVQKRMSLIFLKLFALLHPKKAFKWYLLHKSEFGNEVDITIFLGDHFLISAEAKKIILGIPEENLRDKALDYMLARHPLAATGYENSYRLIYYREYPAEVLNMACKLSDSMRTYRLGQLYSCWAYNDEPAASAWLKAANLSTEEKKDIELSWLSCNSGPSF